MRKVEKYIYLILGVILVGVISTGVTYILMDKENNTEIKENDKQEESKKDNNEKLANSVKFKEIKRDNNKILESFDIILNNKKSVFDIEYTYEADEIYVKIKGILPNSKEENLIDLINLQDEGIKYENSINKNFNENNLKSKITENSFKFIKGEDDLDYLLIVVETDNFSGGPSAFLYAYNDNLKLVTGDVSYDSCSIDKEAMSIVYGITYNETAEEPGKSGYKNNFNLTKEYNNPINVKIEGNNIYYLKADIDYGNIPADGILEERIYTIKNSKWTYKVNNKFKIIDSSGSAC